MNRTTTEAAVMTISQERTCSARLPNDILVVFAEPPGLSLRLGDRLRFMDLELDADVRVLNVTQGHEFMVHIAAHDVHDLRLPACHGGSRTPTRERLHTS
jgi:hypothetical protein